MENSELMQSRLNLFKNAVTGKEKNTRTPYLCDMWSWKVYDAGYKYSEALYDYDIMEKVIRYCAETYPVDIIFETGFRNPVQATGALGNDAYIINDDTYSINIHDQCYMEENEYDALIANPVKFLWEIFLPRKFKLLKNKNNAGDFGRFLGEFGKFGSFMGNITNILINDYGIPPLFDQNAPYDNWGHGYEILFCILRGIKGLPKDIRRQPDKVLAAIEAIDETFVKPRWYVAEHTKGSNPYACFDAAPVMLGHTILSEKQFEKFYWPYLKKVIDYLTNYKKIGFLTMQGANERFYPFLQDVALGTLAVSNELDDIFQMKKSLPNITVTGGMPVDLMGKGTPQQCVDYAKKLIDELGKDGKYIFSENKMMSFPYDCKAENLKAVSEFVVNYKL